MRHKVPEKRINKISETIKSLKRNRPLLGVETGKNLSLDMLYKNGTQALNNRLFKNNPSNFISKDSKAGSYKIESLVNEITTKELMEDYYEKTSTY